MTSGTGGRLLSTSVAVGGGTGAAPPAPAAAPITAGTFDSTPDAAASAAACSRFFCSCDSCWIFCICWYFASAAANAAADGLAEEEGGAAARDGAAAAADEGAAPAGDGGREVGVRGAFAAGERALAAAAAADAPEPARGADDGVLVEPPAEGLLLDGLRSNDFLSPPPEDDDEANGRRDIGTDTTEGCTFKRFKTKSEKTNNWLIKFLWENYIFQLVPEQSLTRSKCEEQAMPAAAKSAAKGPYRHPSQHANELMRQVAF